MKRTTDLIDSDEAAWDAWQPEPPMISKTAQTVLDMLHQGRTLTSYGPDADHAQNVVEATPGAMIAGINDGSAVRYLFGVQPAVVRSLINGGYICEAHQTSYTYRISASDRTQTVHAIHWRLL